MSQVTFGGGGKMSSTKYFIRVAREGYGEQTEDSSQRARKRVSTSGTTKTVDKTQGQVHSILNERHES